MLDFDDPLQHNSAGQLPGVRLQVLVVGDYKALSAFLRQGVHHIDAANLSLWMYRNADCVGLLCGW